MGLNPNSLRVPCFFKLIQRHNAQPEEFGDGTGGDDRGYEQARHICARRKVSHAISDSTRLDP